MIKVALSLITLRTIEPQDSISGYLTLCLIARPRRTGQSNGFLTLVTDVSYWSSNQVPGGHPCYGACTEKQVQFRDPLWKVNAPGEEAGNQWDGMLSLSTDADGVGLVPWALSPVPTLG